MLDSLVLVMKSALEVALVTAIFLLLMKKTGLDRLRTALWLGLVGSICSAVGVVYMADFFGDREIFEGYLFLVASATACVVWFGEWFLLRNKEISSKSRQKETSLANFSKATMICVTFWILSASKVVEIVLVPKTLWAMDANFLSTDLILKISAALLGLLIAFLLTLTLVKMEGRISSRCLLFFSGAVFAAMVIRQLIIVLQIAFATGILPLTTWAVTIIAPLINDYYPLFFYLIIGVIWILWGQVHYLLKNNPPNTSIAVNPAGRRKLLANFQKEKGWAKAAGVVLLAVAVLLGGNMAMANRQPKIEPPTPMTAENGKISIPLEKINDGKLHRFSFTTSGNIETRFIVIKKGDKLYGTGLDACDICGQAGYYQRDKEVICKNCDVVINIPTIGFPGGCNPIPIKNKLDGKVLSIDTQQLESNQDVFKD